MPSIRIQGPTQLQGEVWISGAKNAALPLLASSLLVPGKTVWQGVPALQDIDTMMALLRNMGAIVRPTEKAVEIDASTVDKQEAPYEQVRAMRASILVLGPLLTRFGRARVALPGGCAIGSRPVDQHLRGLEMMGATISLERGDVVASCQRLHGASIVLDMPTVGGTQNILMAATLARGTTTIENAAREPEICDLAEALCRMGARIQGAGGPVIEVEGVEALHPATHRVMPDRIEAGTFLAAAAGCRGDVWVRGCRPGDLDAVLGKLRDMGASLTVVGNDIHVQGPAMLSPFDITTQPHPGFPTDLQALFLSLACKASGASTITETLFENRFMHVPELVRMGASIRVHGQSVFVHGPASLSGTEVSATDLRAAAGLAVAGLMAQGETILHQIHHLDRGYEQFEKKLQGLGASITRIE